MDRLDSSPRPPPARAPGAARPLRIFIVENHEDTRFLLGLLLEQLGHTVFSAATLADALGEMPDGACDVLISDIGLPDGNGWELMTRLGDAAAALRDRDERLRHGVGPPAQPRTSAIGITC